MAGGMKRLAGETAIYGVSSIVGKFLNWMLVPMYTRVLATESDYGIVTNLYAWTALLMVILTYGMETGFFRFMNKKEITLPMRVYATTLFSIAFTSVLFVVLIFSALTPISNSLGYGANPEFVGMMSGIVAVSSAIFVAFRLWKINALYIKLQESNHQVILASEKAQESERMKNAFIKNMCHEVRTPLNAINGFADLITEEDITAEEKQEFSKIIFENCNHITSMMNSVLEIAQLDSNKEELSLSPVNIHLLCSCEMEQLKRLNGKADIEYRIEGDREKDIAYTNANHFSLILSHLLNNANKFTKKGNIILSYKAEEEQNQMVIHITDTGCGISSDKREWIFERFTKADDFVPGSGLGLYLCRQIAHRMKGKIYVDPDYSAGLRIVLTLPLKPE